MKTKQKTIVRLNILFLLLMVSACYLGCKKNKQNLKPTENASTFLKGYWNYSNGAQAFYDGTSSFAQGTKVPTSNNCFNFVIGENYWQNLQLTGNYTWNLNHIIRYCPSGTKIYSSSTFTKIDEKTIKFENGILGTEYLTKQP